MGEMASWRKVVRGKFALNLATPAYKFDPNFTSNSPFSSGLDPHLFGAEFSIFRMRILRAKFVCRALANLPNLLQVLVFCIKFALNSGVKFKK